MSDDMDLIDKILKETLKVMDESKYQIFEISESSHNEHLALSEELQSVMDEMTKTIAKVDETELKYKHARIRLTEVSRDFKKFKEDHIRTAYVTATEYQMDLAILREKEENLRLRRNDLQLRLKNVEKTIERAESIVSQMSVVLDYLSGDLSEITRIIESAKNRQMLGLKIILAQEEERKRVAREVHDGLAQSMANLVLRTEITEKMLERKQYDEVKDEIIDLKEHVREGLGEVRKIIFNLRPMTLDDLGLVPTLRKVVQDFEEKHDIRADFSVLGKEVRLPSAIEVALFRFVQEAFANVLKHAKASYTNIELTFSKEEVSVIFQDNGQGFSVEKVASHAGDHLGLVGMRERIVLLGGDLEINTSEHSGTKLVMTIPIITD